MPIIVPLARRLQEDGLIRAGCIEFCPGWGCNPAKARPRLMFGFYGLGVDPGVSCLLDKHNTNELHPQPDSLNLKPSGCMQSSPGTQACNSHPGSLTPESGYNPRSYSKTHTLPDAKVLWGFRMCFLRISIPKAFVCSPPFPTSRLLAV